MSADLIKKLEEATEGSRELDIALGQALGLIDTDLIYTERDGSLSGRGNCDPWPKWTDSVDRSLALADRVFDGSPYPWLCRNRGTPHVPAWSAEMTIGHEPGEGKTIETEGATPALALCAAILKALHQKETTT